MFSVILSKNLFFTATNSIHIFKHTCVRKYTETNNIISQNTTHCALKVGDLDHTKELEAQNKGSGAYNRRPPAMVAEPTVPAS